MPPGLRPAIPFHKNSLYYKKIHRLQPTAGLLFFGVLGAWVFFLGGGGDDFLKS